MLQVHLLEARVGFRAGRELSLEVVFRPEEVQEAQVGSQEVLAVFPVVPAVSPVVLEPILNRGQ